MVKKAICPSCGKKFDTSKTTWTLELNRHHEKEHGEKLDSRTRARKRKLKEAGVEFTEDEAEETDEAEEKVDLIDRDIQNAEPKKGIFKKKPYGSSREESGSRQESKNEVSTPSREEGKDELLRKSSGSDLFGLTENLDQAKKWGTRALIAGAIGIAIFISFRAYRQVDKITNQDNQTQSESSQGEGDNEGDGKSLQSKEIERNPEPKGVENGNKDNGHKHTKEFEGYLTSEDL